MSNTLTGLIPDIYEALDVVSREQVGFVMAASANNNAERAAVGQNVVVPIYGEETATDIVVGVNSPDDGDNSTGSTQITLTHAKRVPVRLSGKDTVGLNHGVGVSNYRAGRFAQGFRKLANLMEASIGENYKYASRAFGAAGTTPFADGIEDSAELLRILTDNGAPRDDLRCVVNSAAAAKLRANKVLTKVNESGTDLPLRTGALLDINGFRFGETGQHTAVTHTAGTGTSYQSNGGAAVGATSIEIDSGSGTIVAGDIVSFEDDSNKYVVVSYNGGTLTIAAPGLRQNLADNKAVTISGGYSANVAFARSAMHLVARAPELPEEGDMAKDRQLVTDPFSGLTFEIAMYAQYRQMQYEISLVWGSKVVKPEHMALLLG